MLSVISIVEGAVFENSEGTRSRRMFASPASVPGWRVQGEESELGQVVVEVREEVAVIAAKLSVVMILQRGGHGIEHIQERPEGLIGELGWVVENEGVFAHEGLSGWG
jgi:hypothetical protein